MYGYFVILFGLVGCILVSASSSDTSLAQDTYVDAFQSSHNTEYGAIGGYQYNMPPDNNYLPPASAPGPVYGLPQSPLYNPPPPVFYKHSHPTPYNTNDSFLGKLKSKINLFTLGKIILKLLIFKKIIKFIGLICLLLVLPKLKHIFSDSMTIEDEGMNSKHVETDKDKLQKHINEVYDFIMSSIQDFEV